MEETRFSQPLTGGLFRLGEQLGTGARATVYAGTHARSGRPLAFKVAATPEGNHGLLAEYRVLRTVRHPNIVAAHALIRLDDGRCALVLDRVPGQCLARCAPLPLALRAEAALALTRGVAALHCRGVVHGDISPANIMVDVQDNTLRLCLIDPGLGREVAGVDGTLGYLAPEVLRAEGRSAAADLYSLGCVIYEIFEEHPPFTGDDEPLTHQHLHAQPTPPTSIPPPVASLLRQLLAKDPSGRPASAEHALIALAEAFGRNPEQELSHLGLGLLASTPQPAVPQPWRNRLLGAIDHLMTQGRGAFFVASGEVGSGRSAAADELLVTGAMRGAWPRRIVDPSDGLFAPQNHTWSGATHDDDPVMAAVRRLGRRPMPAVLVVDAPRDDAATLARVAEVLQTAARTMPLVAVMVVETSRAPSVVCPWLEIAPLTPESTARFLDEWLAPTPEVHARLLALFGQAGVRTPAAARQLLREAMARGLLVRRPGTWTTDGPRLQAETTDLIRETAAWVEAQIRTQPPEIRRVLAAVSVLGRPVARATLLQLTQMPAPALDHALWMLEVEGLVRSAPDARVSPGHEGLAEAALRLLGPAGTQALHRLALSLPDEHLGHELAPAERTWHRLHAGDPVEWSEIVNGARMLLRIHDPSRALRLLDAQEAIAGRGGHAAARLRSEARLAMGDLTGARAVLEAALEATPDETLSLALCNLLIRQGEFHEALRRLETLGGVPAARLDHARALQWTGAYERADTQARVLVDDDTLPDPIRAGALHVRATCAWHRGDLALAERLATEGLSRVGQADRPIRADLLRSLGAARYYRGNTAGAREVLLQALAENRSLGRVPELAKTLNNLAMVLYGTGDWNGAAGLWDEFRLICARLGDPIELAHAHNNLGFLSLRLGDADRAATLFRACIDHATENGYHRIVPIARANLGEALALSGDFDAAEAAMNLAEEGLDTNETHVDLMELQRHRAELDLMRNRPDDALARVSLIGSELQPELAPLESAHLLRISAAAHRQRGRVAEAEPLARDALARFEEQSARFESGLAREELARCLQALGRTVEANRYSNEALDTFRFLGARRDQERATALRRDLMRQNQAGSRFARHGEVLLDVALHFGSTLDLDLLLPRVLHRLVELLNAERGLVALFDANGQVERAVTHNLTWNGRGHPLPLSQSLQEEVSRQGRAVIVDDVRTEAQTARWESVVVEGLRSLVGLPLQARGGETIGILYFDTHTHLADDPRDAVELLTGISRLLGTAIENARLFRAERFRAELLADLAHNFQSPLSVILANAEVVVSEFRTDPDLTGYTTDIMANAQRMSRMVDHTLELARAEASSRTHEPERLDLVPALEKQLNGMQMLARGQNLRLRLDAARDLPPVHTIPDRLWIVLDNLVFNAMKFAREGTTVIVGVERRADAGPLEAVQRVLPDETDIFRRAVPILPDLSVGFLQISVANQGRPVPPDLRHRLFTRYQYAERTARGVKSTGLGLSIVAQCCRHLGGTVWLDQATEHDTRIAFTLPLGVLKPG